MTFNPRYYIRERFAAQKTTIRANDKADGNFEPRFPGGNDRRFRFGGKRHRLHHQQIGPCFRQPASLLAMFRQGNIEGRRQPGGITVFEWRN